jgi:hypothetical protein
MTRHTRFHDNIKKKNFVSDELLDTRTQQHNPREKFLHSAPAAYTYMCSTTTSHRITLQQHVLQQHDNNTTQFGIISITWQVLIYRQYNHTTTACYKKLYAVINMQWQKIIYISWQVLCVTQVAIKLSFYMIRRVILAWVRRAFPDVV